MKFLLGFLTAITIVWASHFTYLNTDNGKLHTFASKLDDILNGQATHSFR